MTNGFTFFVTTTTTTAADTPDLQYMYISVEWTD